MGFGGWNGGCQFRCWETSFVSRPFFGFFVSLSLSPAFPLSPPTPLSHRYFEPFSFLLSFFDVSPPTPIGHIPILTVSHQSSPTPEASELSSAECTQLAQPEHTPLVSLVSHDPHRQPRVQAAPVCSPPPPLSSSTSRRMGHPYPPIGGIRRERWVPQWMVRVQRGCCGEVRV